MYLKFIIILKALYTNTSGRMRVRKQLSSLLESSGRVRQGCPISLFLFNFAVDGILETTLKVGYTGSVELLPEGNLFDLEYVGDIVLLCNYKPS